LKIPEGEEEFEDTKGVIINHNSKDGQHIGPKKAQTTIYKTQHKTKDRATRILLKKTGVNSGAPEG